MIQHITFDDRDTQSSLPAGWATTTVGDIIELEYGKGLPKPKRDATGQIPVYGSNGVVGYHCRSLVDGPCIIVGRKGGAGEVHLSKSACYPIDTTYFVRQSDKLDLNFVFYLLKKLKLGQYDRSTAIPGLNRDDAYGLPIHLPPLAEQHRIVLKIEELFTQLDAGVAALEKVRAQLRRYRKAVLAVACDGRLTEEWRKSEGHQSDNTIQELSAPDNYPEVPGSWTWQTVENVVSPLPRSIQSGPFGSNLLHSEFQKQGVLVIGIDNVQNGYFSFGRQHRISFEKYHQLEKYSARPLDFLVTVMATIGRCCLIPEGIETAIISKHVYRITLDQDRVVPNFFLYLFQGSPFVDSQIRSQIRGQTRPGINGKILKRIVVPLPPLLEQHEIVNQIERLLSIVDAVERTIGAGLRQAETLRQSILKRAFEGKLVPQDANDKPASLLLERIKAEKKNTAIILTRKKKRSQQSELVWNHQ